MNDPKQTESPRKSDEEDVTQIGPPTKSTRPPPMAATQAVEDEDTQRGLPSKSNLPPPVSGTTPAPPPKFDENDETRTGLPEPSNLPPPISGPVASKPKFDVNAVTTEGPVSKRDVRPPSSVDPQDATDPDEAVTQIADPPSRKK